MGWVLSAFADEAGEGTGEQVSACVAGGVRWIDPRSVDGYNVTRLPLEVAKRVATAYGSAGIGVHMFGSPIGKIDIADDVKIDLDRLEHLARLRDTFGANRVRVFSYYNKAGVDRAKWAVASLDRLKRLRDRAGALGMMLYHENESGVFGDHPQDVGRIAELRDGRTFGLIYDFANYLRSGATPAESWAVCRAVTDCFHLKDQKRDGQHVPMGRGDTDAEAILREAVAAGWEGAFVLEPHLTHSEAVVSTNVHGTGDQSLSCMTPGETFAVAAAAAKGLLARVGVEATG